MRMFVVGFKKPYRTTTMYYILFSTIVLAGFILLTIGSKLREGAGFKSPQKKVIRVRSRPTDATTRSTHNLVISQAIPTAWERRNLAKMRKNNTSEDGKFECNPGMCPDNKVCLSQSDCVTE